LTHLLYLFNAGVLGLAPVHECAPFRVEAAFSGEL
jgi:hypothetical protein